jgi:hypothetical protein
MQSNPDLREIALRLVAIPSNTPEDADLRVAGNFNDWSLTDPNGMLAPHPDGGHVVSVRARLGDRLEYKFHRGDWETVETTADTEPLQNRVLWIDDQT